MPLRQPAALLLLLLTAPWAASGCGAKNTFQPPPPPKVTVAPPLQKEIVETIEFTGTTRATARVDLRAQVGGILEKIGFEDGATVKEGDLLFRIEQAPFEAKVQLAKAGLQRAEANQKKADLAVARAEKLFKQSAAPESDLENAQALRDTATADVSAAQAELRDAELQLGYTEIRAPITGRISRHLVDRGNLVQAQSTSLATIESISPIHALFYVSEREILRFMELRRTNAIPDPIISPVPLFLGLVNEKGFPHKGYLDYREFGVDPGTGTILRRAVFENDQGELIPGLFVRIQAPLGKPAPQLLIEERAIGTDQRGEYVLLVGPKNEVEYRLVDLGPSIDGMRVVKSGVSAGDRIIINGLQRARPGGKVTPEEGVMQPAVAGGVISKAPAQVTAPEQSVPPAGPPRADDTSAAPALPKPDSAGAPQSADKPAAVPAPEKTGAAPVSAPSGEPGEKKG